MTAEEKEELVSACAERVLLMLPQVLGNLMQELAAQRKLTEQLYKDHPEFTKNTDIVRSVMQQVDSETPGKQWKEKVEMAVPIIKSRIKVIGSMDMTKPSRPTDLSCGDL